MTDREKLYNLAELEYEKLLISGESTLSTDYAKEKFRQLYKTLILKAGLLVIIYCMEFKLLFLVLVSAFFLMVE